VQDRLPIWLDYQGPKGARRAGLMGEGLLTLAASSWPHYRDGLAEAGHDRAAARMGGGVQAYLTDDPERDWPLVAPHIAYAQDSYRRYMVEGTDHPAPRPVDPDRLRTRGPDAGPMSYFLFGTPEHVAAAIRDYAGQAPVQTVWLGASVAGLPEDPAARHVQAICTRLRLGAGDGRGGWLGSAASRDVTGRVFGVWGNAITVLEGWVNGPAVSAETRWDQAGLSAVVPGLVAKAAPNADTLGHRQPAA
jgi:hypothetical protein